ncbi:MAG: hypothetical protein RLZ55_799, partial [Actinomycetota bacterium]
MAPPGSSTSPGSAPASPPAADPTEGAPSARVCWGGRETPARVVGIGSSAGGLKSLMAVLRTAPTGAGYCYVVAQHISPDFDSPLTELLARAGDLEVVTAEDGMRLRPDVVFVCPPGSDITVDHEALRLAKPPQDRFAHPRIDLLFVSLASTWGRSCAALVLSGSGLDGSEGIRAVSEAGGVVIAEDPATAEFDSMPRAAIATKLVDVVAKHDQIGAEVGRFTDGRPWDPGSEAAAEDRAVVAEDAAAPAPPEPSDSDVKIVVDQLRTVSGTDVSEYKARTVARQIARRMSVVGAADIPAYRRLLASDEHEASALTSALLIKVTAFLRDPSAWSALEAVLRQEWAGREPGRLVRIWVPGCATGEEAYTIAMMAARVLGILERPDRRIKVFATDLAEDALDAARRGVYSAQDVAPLPDSWRDRWFRREGDGWAVVPGLRDAVVFAAHNVAVDPAFPGIDLVCLRNTLIYFQESLQHQALGMCHYALVPGGILFLGNSERIAPDDTRFEAVDTLHRIYRRTPDASGAHRAQRRTIRAAAAVAEPRERESLHDELIASFVPPSLLIDADDDVIEVVGDVSQWCAVAVGPRSNHVVALVREDLRVPVLALIVRLREGGSVPVTLDVPTDSGPVRITARLLDPSGTAILAFGQADVDAEGSLPPEGSFGDAGSGELAATRATLQAVIEDLSASNEELRALNEELQAAGEEAQSSSEELEAANEELSTLNQELQVRTADLMAAKAYLESIESAVSAGLLVVDHQGRITRFTAQAVRLFALIPSDIGRPLADIPTTAPVPGLAAMVAASSRDGKAVMADIVGAEHDYLLQARPYPSLPQAGPSSGGAVLIVTDVTELSRARRAAARAAAQVAAITDSLEPVVWQRDSAGRLVFLSRSVESLLGLHRERVLADQSLLVAAIHPDDREQVALASAAAADRRSQEYRVIRSDGEVRWVRETVTTSDASPAVDRFTVGTLVDITSRHRARDEAEGASQTVHALMEVERLGVVLLDKDDRIVRANPAFAALASHPADELVGMPLDVFLAHPGVDTSHAGSVPWPEGTEAHHSRFVAGDGS